MTSKTVLITGATSGIGLSLYNQYMIRGDRVIACGRDEGKLANLAGDAFQTLQFDLNNPEEIKQALHSLEELGELDIVILNAGDCRYIDDAKQFDAQLFDDLINTNLASIGWLLQSTLPHIRKGGQLVFISSSATILPFPRSEAYGASKAGMDYLANSLRLDLAPESIDVTLVHPGFVKTPLTDKNDFNMPFLITSEQAAARIIEGVDKRKPYLHFPKRLTFILKIISLMPSLLWQKIMARKSRSLRKSQGSK